jgi:hypothetical protein
VVKELQRAGVRGLPLFNLCSNCRILRITDQAAGTVEYHGLVEVQPARIALQAIQILNGKEIGRTPIEVRRYRHRSAWGEHQHRSDSFRGGALVARPLLERRRGNVKIELLEATPAVENYEDETALAT